VAHAVRTIPEENALLCEGCGYIVSGLPRHSRCPECSKPIIESLPHTRRKPLWERTWASGRFERFWRTTIEVIIHPRRFFRTCATRSLRDRSGRFALVHNSFASLLFGFAAFVQSKDALLLIGLDDWANWERLLGRRTETAVSYLLTGTLAFAAAAFVILTGGTSLAARLTAWEAGYRGLRLPLRVVARGLHYHSAHYLPVALLAAITVGAFHLLRHFRLVPITWETPYIYLLCGEVVLGAGYLFKTYWIAMRNMMFANR
jgi:hypothetical protein